jgi:hypothetical protein
MTGRRIFAAQLVALAVAWGHASAAPVQVNFSIGPSGWFGFDAGRFAYDLPADPSLVGTFTYDDSYAVPNGHLFDAEALAALTSFDLTVGDLHFDFGDLNLAFGYGPFAEALFFRSDGYLQDFAFGFKAPSDARWGRTSSIYTSEFDADETTPDSYFATNRVTFFTDPTSPPAPIPEPSDWALLAVAIAAIGAKIRFNRATLASA